MCSFCHREEERMKGVYRVVKTKFLPKPVNESMSKKCSQIVSNTVLYSPQIAKRVYWTGLPLPSPGVLPDPRIESHLLHWQADSLLLSHLRALHGYILLYKFIKLHTLNLYGFFCHSYLNKVVLKEGGRRNLCPVSYFRFFTLASYFQVFLPISLFHSKIPFFFFLM